MNLPASPAVLLLRSFSLAACLSVGCPRNGAAAPGDAGGDGRAPELRLAVDPAGRDVRVERGGVVLLRYVMDPAQFKPYVKEFRTLRGQNLILDSPADHVHHHGLMYAITVNGTNFWEEHTAPGVQLPLALTTQAVRRGADGRSIASFSHPNFWVAHTQRSTSDPKSVAVLVEQRTLELAVDDAAGEVALTWRSEFTVGPGAAAVTLSGAGYHGLGMRYVRDLDLKARHLNSEGAPYSAEQKWDVIAAKWAATQGRVGAEEVTVAMFAAPGNAGPSRFFSMINAFAYLSATQGLDEQPLSYAAGDRFHLTYLVLNRTGHADPATLQRRYQAWVQPGATPASR